MNSRQELTIASIDSALAVIGQADFQTPRISRLARELEAARQEIKRLARDQNEAGLGLEGPLELRAAPLRRVLRRDHLRPISKEGGRLLKGMPGIKDSLRLPRARASDKELLAATKRILKNAAPYSKVFREAGFHADFIARARHAADLLAAELAKPVVSKAQVRSRYTALIPAALSNAREIIASIDTMVEADLANDRVALSVWRKGKKIPKKAGRPRKRRPAPE